MAKFEPVEIHIAFEDNPNTSVNSVDKSTWEKFVLQTYNSLMQRHSATVWQNQTEYKNWVIEHITDALLENSDTNYNHPLIDILLYYIRNNADLKELLDCITVSNIDVYPSTATNGYTDFEVDGIFDPNILSVKKRI